MLREPTHRSPGRPGVAANTPPPRPAPCELGSAAAVGSNVAVEFVLVISLPTWASNAWKREALTGSATTLAPEESPSQLFQVIPRFVVKLAEPRCSAQTMVRPSALKAILPCPLLPPGGSLARASQFLPPSSEIMACVGMLPPPLPMRTISSGLLAANARSRVLDNRGPAKVPSAGETSTLSWRKPSMSPTPLIKWTPAGGLIKASGTVSSSPWSRKPQCVGLPESAFVTLVQHQMPKPVVKSTRSGLNG